MNIPEPLRLVALAILAPLLLLGPFELAARIYELGHPITAFDFDSGFAGVNRIFTPKPGDPSFLVTRKERAHVFISQEFLAKKPADTFRVVFLGESSVAYLSALLPIFRVSLEALVPPRYRRVEILNLGAPSYGSQRITLVAREMLGYEPDLFLIYMGHNEFEEVEQFHLSFPSFVPLLRLANYSAIFRLATDALVSAQVRRLRRLKLEDRPRFDLAARFPFTMRDLEERMISFRQNLEGILALCAAHGVHAVLASVPSNLKAPDIPAAFASVYQPAWAALAAGDFERARLLGTVALAKIPGRHQSSARENRIIRNAAQKFNVPMADVERAVIAAEPHHLPGETLFVDHCHMNERGNLILLQEFFETIRRNPQVMEGR